jgi:ABC-type branched-subunit amino acid transport system substrate-binding protein
MADVLAEAVALTQPDRAVIVGEQPLAAAYEEALNTQGLRAQLVPPPALDDESIGEWATYLVLSRVRPPDALILTTDGASAGEVLLALAAPNWRGMAFGGQEVGSAHLVDVAGEKATGLVFVSPAPAGSEGLMNTAGDSSSDKHDLRPRGVLAYDAAHVLLDAIELAIQQEGVPGRQGVVFHISRVQRHGLTGEIGFDQAGRRLQAPVWLYSIGQEGYPGQVLASPQAIE